MGDRAVSASPRAGRTLMMLQTAGCCPGRDSFIPVLPADIHSSLLSVHPGLSVCPSLPIALPGCPCLAAARLETQALPHLSWEGLLHLHPLPLNLPAVFFLPQLQLLSFKKPQRCLPHAGPPPLDQSYE